MNLNAPEYYINRELSWLRFNERVLDEARQLSLPVLERLRFLGITASNLDEFYMVRVAGLKDQLVAEFAGRDPSGLNAAEQLRLISKHAHEFVSAQYECLNGSIMPALDNEGIRFRTPDDLSDTDREQLERYFNSTVYPILTPMAIDQNRPFPLLGSKTLNLAVELQTAGYAVVPVPSVIPRIIPLSGNGFIFLEDLVKQYIDRLFTGFVVLEASVFRIIRDADLSLREDDVADLLGMIEKSVKRRKWGAPVRLEAECAMTGALRRYLLTAFELDGDDIYEIPGPLDLTVWYGFSPPGFERLRLPEARPAASVFADRDPFETLRARDVLVHHPYESFDSVVDFVKAAASDPRVLAIKQTLYRVSGDSQIIAALIEAVENGKQVTALVELMARFDEENNINWAKRLEASGAHVVYGLSGLKTHCKLMLVVRKEDDGIRRYIHMGTGNYNDSTARAYTDLGYFTAKETFAQDISSLFNVLTGYSTGEGYKKIAAAPSGLRAMFIRLIEHETKNAAAGKPAGITAKMNSLVDERIIEALYRASQAGVRIRLIVRGVCCLRPGIPGVSDNITVGSIVDRFLEHARIFLFENGGSPRVFLSSADWMPRNLDRRVEVAFPLDDEELIARASQVLELGLADTRKLRLQNADGTYSRVPAGEDNALSSQQALMLGHRNRTERERTYEQ